MASGDILNVPSQVTGKPITLVDTQFNTATTPVSASTQVIALGYDNNSTGSPVVAQLSNATPVGSEYALIVRPINASFTGTPTTVTVTASSTLVLNTNNVRVGATFYNTGNYNINLALGFTPTTSLFTCVIPVGGFFETPFGFKGTINAISTSSSSSTLVVTELT